MQMCANIYLRYTLYGLNNTVWVRIKGGYGRTDEGGRTGGRRADNFFMKRCLKFISAFYPFWQNAGMF